MQSHNPILNRSETFNPRAAQQYGHAGYPAGGQGHQGYGQAPAPQQGSDPSTWTYPQGAPPSIQERMTIDSVVMRTAITLGLVILSAALTWIFLPDGSEPGENNFVGLAFVAALVGAGLGIWLSFKRSVSPPLVMLYAVIQGFFLGAVSEVFEQQWPGIVISAVVGTFAAFAGTLAAYKFFNIQVTSRMRKFGMIAALSFIFLAVGDLILSFFNADLGLNGFGWTGLIFSVIGLGLGVFFLILDFDMIERGVAMGAPESESWRAAFGLTATLIFIYIELLRIIAILRGDG